MSRSISVIVLGVASIASNNLQAYVGSYIAPNECDLRRVTHLSVKPLNKGGYIKETYNTGSVRKFGILPNPPTGKQEMDFLETKELRIDEEDGSETVIFMNPLCIYNNENRISGKIKHRDGKVMEFTFTMYPAKRPAPKENADLDEGVKDRASLLVDQLFSSSKTVGPQDKGKERSKTTESEDDNDDGRTTRINWISSSSSSISTTISEIFETVGASTIQGNLRAWKAVPEVFGLRDLIHARQMHYKNYREDNIQGKELEFFHSYVGQWGREGVESYIVPHYKRINDDQIKKDSHRNLTSASAISTPPSAKRWSSFIARLIRRN